MKQLTLIFLICWSSVALFCQTNNPTIAVCNGQQYVCATSQNVNLCVSILVNPNYPNASIISGYRIKWGDGSPETIVPGGLNPPNQTHVYNVGSFFGSCTFSTEYTIILYTMHSDPAVEDANSAFILTIRNPPQATFTMSPNPVCLGQSVTLTSTACPTSGLNYRTWDLGGGITGSGTTFTHTFTTAGAKTIQHCAGNVCDTVCTTQVLQVFNPAIASLVADSGVIQPPTNPYKVCLDGGSAVVRLNAGASANTTQYQWSVSPTTGWQWVPPGTPNGSVARIRFSVPGTYTVTLRANNQCNQEDTETIAITVIDAPKLNLNPFPDNCVPTPYTPSPLTPNASYTINGNPVSSFPVTLDLSPNPYIIQASLSNECGMQVLSDTVFIRPAEAIDITSPASALTVCTGAAPVLLTTTTPGFWSGDGGNIIFSGGDTLFQPVTAGVYTLVASIGTGVCRQTDTVRISVEQAYPLALDAPADACLSVGYTPSPFDPQAAYAINGTPQTTFPLTLDDQNSPYTITATANNACGDVTLSATLNVLAPVEVSILAPLDTVLCSGGVPIPLLASDSIGQWSGLQIIQIPGGPAFDPMSPGDFQLVFARGFDACRRADTLNIRVEPGDGVSLGPDLFLCNTQAAATLTANQGNGVYTGFALNGNTIDIGQLQLDTPYLYAVTIPSLPAACNSDEATVTVSAPPAPAFQLDRDTSCIGALVSVATQADPNVQYTVDWGDGATNNSTTHTYSAPGLYPISLQAQLLGPAGCTASASASVYVIQPIQAANIQFDMTPDSGCAPLSVTFANNSFAENAVYRWEFGNNQTFNGQNPGAVVFEQGTEDTSYTVRLIVDNGCDTFVVSRTVTVFPQPRADFGITYTEPCSGGVLETSVRSTGNPASNTYFTSTGLQVVGSLIESAFFTFFTDSLPDTVGIWLVTSNFCGIDTAFREVVVNPTDVVALIGLPDTTAICAGTPVSVINYATPGAPVAWAVSDGNTYIGDTIDVVFADPGLYRLTLYAFGCGFDSMTMPIQVQPLPALEVTHDPIRCPGDPVSFSAVSDAPAYLLRFGDGDSTLQKITQHVYTAPGVYAAEARARSNAGCTSAWSGQVTVLTPPEAALTADDSLCAGATAAFSGQSSIAGSACSWQFGDGNGASGCQATHAYPSPGLFTARLITTSPEGCRDTAFAPVYVRAKPDARFSYDIVEPCSPASVQFQSDAQGATGLLWDTGDGRSNTLNAFTHTYDAGGTYTVALYATNEGICFDTATRALTVFQTPVFDLLIDAHCTVDSGTDLRIRTADDNWSALFSADYSQVGDFHIGLQPGVYTVRIQSPEGCENDTAITLLPISELLLSVPEDSFRIRLGETAQLEALVNQADVDFAWAPALHLSDPNGAATLAAPWQPVQYVVTAINAKGCAKQDTVWVDVHIERDSGFFIPNAFTPNDDGVNDLFFPRNSNPAVRDLEVFQVFDKYSEQVFDVKDLPAGDQATPENPAFGWDGRFRERKAEMGAYRYVVGIRYVDGIRKTFTGTVQLIR